MANMSVEGWSEGIVRRMSKACHILMIGIVYRRAWRPVHAMDFLSSRRRIFPEGVFGTASTK